MIREFKSSIMNFEFDQQVERQLPREAGFTLVEIIISLALMLFIASIAYSSLQGIIRSKTILDDRRESRLIANSKEGRKMVLLHVALQSLQIYVSGLHK